MADRILGSQFLEDIAEFFILFQTMYDGFVERAEAVTRTLADRRTTFVVVSHARGGAGARGRVLHRRARRARAPPRRRRAEQGAAARTFVDDTAAARPGRGAVPHGRADRSSRSPSSPRRRRAHVARVLREVGESFLNYQVVAKREAEQRAELARTPEVVAAVPYFDTDIYDLAGLLRLGEQIWR